MVDTINISGHTFDAQNVLDAIEEAASEDPGDDIKHGVGEAGDIRVMGDGHADRDVVVYDIGGTIEKVARFRDADDLIERAEANAVVEPGDVSSTWMHAWTPSQDAYAPAAEADVSQRGSGFTMSADDATILSHDFINGVFNGTFSAKGAERVEADDVPFDDVSDHYDAE